MQGKGKSLSITLECFMCNEYFRKVRYKFSMFYVKYKFIYRLSQMHLIILMLVDNNFSTSLFRILFLP